MTTKQIVNGPSKFDLMVSLLHGEHCDGQQYVTFEIDSPIETPYGETQPKFECQIAGLTRIKHSSDEDWEFTARGIARRGTASVMSQKIRGTYSTRTRKGMIDF